MKVYEYIVRLKDQATDKIKRFNSSIDSGRGKVNQFNSSLKGVEDSANSMGGALSGLSNFLGPAVLGAALSFGALKASALAREFEQTRISFEIMVGDVRKGNALLQDVIQLANVTPFTSRQLEESSKLLLNFSYDIKKVMPALKMLGDISGGNADRLHYLTLAFAQSQAAGRLMGQDLLQMVNAGFNPLQEISRKTGLSLVVLKDRMEKGSISAKIIELAFKSATEQGGKFFHMMDKQGETFEGRLSTMTDKFEIWATHVGAGINKNVTPWLEHVISLLDQVLDKTGKLSSEAESQKNGFHNLETNVKPLIDQYLELSKVAHKTGEQSQKLKDITQQIGNAIPRAADIDKNTGLAKSINAVTAGFFIKEQEDAFLAKNEAATKGIMERMDRIQKDRAIYSGMVKDYQGDKVVGFGDSDKGAADSIKRLRDLAEEEGKLSQQLSKLRMDRVAVYNKDKQSNGGTDWGSVKNDILTGGKLKNGIDNITGGGKHAVNVTINVAELIGIKNIEKVVSEKGIEDMKKQLEQVAIEAMLRTVNSANYVATQ